MTLDVNERGSRVVVVLPAYNAANTLADTVSEIDNSVVDEVILVDDASQDGTVALAEGMGLVTVRHARNMGYGGNQKTCYRAALTANADIVVMLHPDYQYTPKLLPAMVALIDSGLYDIVLGSRILGKGARRGGMPLYRYVANRLLTFFQNVLLREKLSEFHTGYRAFSRRVLAELPLAENSDDFLFDNQILGQAIYFGFRIGEVTCPTRYEPRSSSINVWQSMKYGLGVIWTSMLFLLAKWRFVRPAIFSPGGRRLI
jgi:glycosyltransferase involved in cell wall biosynthesis